ncbi:MAG TPA: 1-deoxy-D-xylulose-5-phosphate synthase [candidate division Zixibacteria bacterium]
MAKLLDSINSPQDLKKIPLEDLPKLAAEIREEIITVVSKNGGHLASNLGAIELSIALHYVLDSPRDKIVWDVGHQCYTHKLITGRREKFSTLRKYKGISGFPKKKESEHDAYEVGHASTSISAALGMACARDYLNQNFHIAVVVGDGALTGGLSFEGMNNSGALSKNMLVVLNDNTMSISKNVGALSKYLTNILTDEKYNKIKAEVWDLVGKFKRRDKIRTMVAKVEEHVKGFLVPGIIFEKLGFRYFGPIDGHDIQQLVRILEHIKNLSGPVLLHVLTQKGKGYKYAEEDAPRFHGIGVFDKVTGNSDTQPGQLSYTDVFGQAIVELAEKDEKIVAITAAMSLGTGLVDFAKKFPNRFYDVGIAEQHGTTFACGLATLGMKPVFAVYSTFLQRAFDQVLHDTALQNLPVIFAVDRAGLVGEDGPTHHGAFDLSYLRQIPNLTIMAPKDGNELRGMLNFAVSWNKGPVVIRYPRGTMPDEKIEQGFKEIKMASWEVLRSGEDILVLAVGSMVYPSLEAAQICAENGIDVCVVNARFVKPLDENLLSSFLRKFNRIITVEENALAGGFGSAILEYIEAQGIRKKISVKRMGIPDSFIQHGSRKTLLEELHLDRDSIVQLIKQTFTFRKKKVIAET